MTKTSESSAGDAMTRSEEELQVRTTQRESARVRLQKYIVTEMVTMTVPVRREGFRLEREPITEPNRGQVTPGAEVSDEEYEIILHEEEVVIEKRIVPKERVRVIKDVEGARRILQAIAEAGIEYDDVVATLEREGVEKFSKSFAELLEGIEDKRKALVSV